MKKAVAVVLGALGAVCLAQAQQGSWMPDITRQQDYSWHLSSSFEKTGGNADSLALNPGQTLTVLDTDGPGMVSHIWFTINDRESYYLKRIVLRMYWDGEKDPSVEAPIGDFFGLGLGISYPWQSDVLSVGNSGALNCFFPMPYRHHARITLTNEGKEAASNLYWNIEYRTYSHPLPADTLYFQAEYRQAQPNHGWTNQWYTNGDPLVNYHRNPDGKDNYVWLEANGHGQ